MTEAVPNREFRNRLRAKTLMSRGVKKHKLLTSDNELNTERAMLARNPKAKVPTRNKARET